MSFKSGNNDQPTTSAMNSCYMHHWHQLIGLQGNSPTNQLAVSQVADWITRGLVNSPTTNFIKT